MLESTAAKWVLPFFASIIALLAPIHALMAGVGFLIFADMVTGIVAARKREEPITSRALSRTVWKAVVYQVAVVSGFALEHLVSGVLPIAKLVAGMIGCVEFLSMSENVKTVTGLDLRSIAEKITKTGR
jgi:hypothetical protein